ncbi:predicted protein [Histoplasma capsulatum var. duboisii H88]|uniref:Predicted protein n=1 Tax=Ajellomyces capsulatus (strain H88) TaxID=544711 RepID=F0UGT4_AJEC8|nr:predicted protein [Histoplasma capsulatum var. duboisii H88]
MRSSPAQCTLGLGMQISSTSPTPSSAGIPSVQPLMQWLLLCHKFYPSLGIVLALKSVSSQGIQVGFSPFRSWKIPSASYGRLGPHVCAACQGGAGLHPFSDCRGLPAHPSWSLWQLQMMWAWPFAASYEMGRMEWKRLKPFTSDNYENASQQRMRCSLQLNSGCFRLQVIHSLF